MPIWNAKHRQNPLLFAQRVNSNDIVLIVQKNQKKYKKSACQNENTVLYCISSAGVLELADRQD